MLTRATPTARAAAFLVGVPAGAAVALTVGYVVAWGWHRVVWPVLSFWPHHPAVAAVMLAGVATAGTAAAVWWRKATP